MVDMQEYQATLDDFNSKIQDCDGLKDRVQEACGKVVLLLRIFGGGAGLITAEEVWERRDQIHRKLEELMSKLGELSRGAAAPLTFIDLADGWKTGVQQHVKNASDTADQKTKLAGYWRGVAADKYGSVRDTQNKSLAAVYEMDTQVAKTLNELADSGWEFYKSVVKSLTDFLAKVATAIGKIAAVVTAPWGLSDTIDLVGKVVTTLVDLALATATNLRTQYKAKLDLQSLPAAQRGFSNGKWPEASTGDYSDATVTDGTNEWSVAPDVIPS
ncbi:hypothetical protein [Mycobacteroides chelonae]|jgi:uncharacterized protein YukE|nr:hypothetical protein [Mycobacteroides chelonae]MBF9318052.1 hypothetical protein [Mycobacteroides chelonae]MBF9524044.1 hypothetical protein [Mycobacteroides chelonae]SKL32614.1 Uncharacterised protein [Mycobacteroides abscessus subsp. bolletii]